MQESNLNHTAPSSDDLIGQCRDAAVACLPSALSVTLGQALNGLIEARPWVGPDSAIELYEQTIGVLRHRRSELEAAFRERLAVLSDPARHQAGQAPTAQDQRPVAQAGLMDEDMHYDFAAPETLAQAIATACKGELYSLDRRFEKVSGVRAWRELPVGPQVIGLALIEAMRQIGLPRTVRQALLPLLAEYLPRQAKPVYQLMNQLLAERGVLPEMKLGLPAKGQADAMAGVCRDWLMRQGRGQGMASKAISGLTLSQAVAGFLQGDAQAAQWLGLSQADRTGGQAILRRIDQAAALRLSAAEKVVLDWTASLFEAKVFAPQVPVSWQARLGRLQLPVLHAALRESEAVMRQPAHPVNRLIDALVEVSKEAWPAPAVVEAQVDTLLDILQGCGNDSNQGFRAALTGLSAALGSFASEGDAAGAGDAEAGELNEAGREEHIIRSALADHRIPGAMEAFLLGHWTAVARRADVTEAEAVLHDLVASLEPAGWRQRRAELTAALPGLLKRLKRLLTQAGIAQEVRDKFFSDLVKCHALLMRATQVKSDDRKAGPESKVA